MPLLSVIVPVYNGVHYFPNLFISLYRFNKEIWKYMEIIVINDGSKDNSLQELKKYANMFSNISVIDKPNGGIASARNMGLSHCHGEYITFCDQDDLVFAGYQSFVELLKNTDSDVLISSSSTSKEVKPQKICEKEATYEREQIESILKFYIGEHVIVTDEEYKEMSLPNIPCTIWNCIFKRALVVSNNIVIKKYVDFEDDWLFIISTLFHAKRIVVTNRAYYRWTVNPQSESHTSKYIDDFFAKRAELKKSLFPILQSLHVSKERMKEFVNKVDAQTVLWGFYNESGRPLSYYMKKIKQIEHFSNIKLYRKYKIGRMSSFYFYLLSKKLYRSSYYINNLTFKRYYH